MRFVTAGLVTLSFLAAPSFALADEDKKTQILDLDKIELPTEGEIEDIIDQLPDFNALMDGILKIAQDEDIRNSLEKASETFSERAEKLGDIETRENGMPDVNLLIETALKTFADEDVLSDVLTVVAELQESVEENLDEDMLKPKRD